MRLGAQLIEQLQLFVAGKMLLEAVPAQGSAYRRLTLHTADTTAALEFFDHDRYSITLRALEIGSGLPIPGDAHAYLSEHAAAIARRLSYLEEPLAVWELDGGERMAQLRSSPPLREGQAVSYWEVTLSAAEGPSARIMRYRWAPGMVEREVVAYPATFALVARIADSLAEALQPLG